MILKLLLALWIVGCYCTLVIELLQFGMKRENDTALEFWPQLIRFGQRLTVLTLQVTFWPIAFLRVLW